MADSFKEPPKGKNFNNSNDSDRAGFRGSRGSGNREGGGFRIRLSDNEMRATRSIQEAFNLRSTVAVLGFAVRTLGQMLEEGKLDEIISEYRTQSPNNSRNQMDKARAGNNNHFNKKVKPNPFARPVKPEINSTEDNQKSLEAINTESTNQEQDNADLKENNHSSESVDEEKSSTNSSD